MLPNTTASKQQNLDIENLINQDLAFIRERIRLNINLLNIRGQYGRTLLHLASIRNRLDVVQLLYRREVNFYERSPTNKNCLHYACEYGSLDTIAWLIMTYPALMYETDRQGRTPLQLAVQNGFSDRILVFLINQYIQNENSNIRSAINVLALPMSSWTREHFLNYLGNDLRNEYSDDSDNEADEALFTNDRQKHSEEARIKAQQILKKYGNYSQDNLSVRLSTLMGKISDDSNSLQKSIKGFTKAQDRRAYFPPTVALREENIQLGGRTFENEIELLNEAIRSNSLKISYSKEDDIRKIKIHGTYNQQPVEYTLRGQYYLPAFRGISYLVDRWNSEGRRTHRRLPTGEDFVNYAEANMLKEADFYKKTDYSHIDITSLLENAKALKAKLLEFKRSQPMIFSKKEGIRIGLRAKSVELLEFQNYLDLLQYMFSNGINNFLHHLESFNQRFSGIFPNSRNPLLPFGHLPFHALKYAFGDKNPYGDFALPPLWDSQGRPRKPHVGKLTLSIHPLIDFLGFDQPNVVPYLTEAAGVTASFDIGPEYELSFLSYIKKSRIFNQRLIRYPSFHHEVCPEKYLAKYGLNETLYQGFRSCILDPNTRENATNVLRNWLCLYHAIKAMEEVSEEISRPSPGRQGTMLFYHPNGSFSTHYPSEAYQAGSEVFDINSRMAETHISAASPIMHDQNSWGTPKSKDKRGIYASSLSPSPRKSPSGYTPQGKNLDLSSTTSYSSISSSDRSFDYELESLNESFSFLYANDDLVVINGREISTSYWYEDSEVQMILQHQIDQHNREAGNGRPLYLLGPLDNLSPLGLPEVLINHNRHPGIALIPFNLSQQHWVGLLLEYNNAGNLIRADYYDSLGLEVSPFLNEVLKRVSRETDLVNEFRRIQEQDGLIRQTNGSDCGPCTIENLLRGAELRRKSLPLNSAEIRLNHFESLEQRNPNFYHSFYERQRTDQSLFKFLKREQRIYSSVPSGRFSLVEYANLLSISLEILKSSSEIKSALMKILQEESADIVMMIRKLLKDYNNQKIEILANKFFYLNDNNTLDTALFKLNVNQVFALKILLALSQEEIEQDLRALVDIIENEFTIEELSDISPSLIRFSSRKITQPENGNPKKTSTSRKLEFLE